MPEHARGRLPLARLLRFCEMVTCRCITTLKLSLLLRGPRTCARYVGYLIALAAAFRLTEWILHPWPLRRCVIQEKGGSITDTPRARQHRSETVMSSITRRQFSAGAVIGMATLGKAASAARDAERVGANERIRVALIGCGGMGRGDLATFLRAPEVQCPLICDVDDAQIATTVKMLKKLNRPEPEAVKDFRRIMDRDDIDAVIVATPDHWHALPTIYACQSGKDVYCEKPLATSIAEGRVMVRAARKHNRVVQMGTQWRSGTHYQDAVRYVQSGKLGKIRLVRCWACLTWIAGIGHPKDCDPPPGVDYDMWLGPAPKRPFNPARFHFNFRWFWDYAGGLMTDWGVHLINIAQWAMQVKAPKAVSASGGKFVVDDISETPDTQCVLFEFGDFIMTWEHQVAGNHGIRRREHGVAFVGTNGTLVVDTSTLTAGK